MRSTSIADEDIETLQTWLDGYVASNDRLVGVSAFIVAGQSPVETVSSGKAVIARAWDATNKKEVTSEEKPVSADTTCMLASVSKLFTWTALSRLLDAGKFELDDAIDNVLSFQIRNPSFQDNPITYRHLYSHTSGIIDDYNRYLYGDQCPSDPMFPFSSTESLEQSIIKVTSKDSNWANNMPGKKFLYR
jgi:CubicO group peptidase (beta-lactamase class C family)